MAQSDTAVIMSMIRYTRQLTHRYPDSVIILSQNSLKLSQAISFNQGTAWSLMLMGDALCRKAEYTKSRYTLLLAARYNKGFSDTAQLGALIYTGMGMVASSTDNYGDAIASYLQALKHANNILSGHYAKEWLLASLFANLAATLGVVGQYDQALYYIALGDQLAAKNKQVYAQALLALNRGAIYKELNRPPDQSLRYFLQSLLLSREHHFSDFEQLAYTNIGELFLSQKQPQKAIPYLQQALQQGAVPEGHMVGYTTVAAMSMLGQAFYELKEYASAESILQQAVENSKTAQYQKHRQDALKTLVLTYAALGKKEQANTALASFIQLRDSLQQAQKNKNITQLESKYSLALKDKEIAQKQILIQKKNQWIIGITILVLLLILFFYNRNRIQSRKIKMLGQQKEIRSLKAMRMGEENERIRISQELHDGIGGMITAINMNLNAIQKKYQGLPPMKELDQVIQQLQDTSAEIRKTSRNLMPDVLLHYSLPEAIRMYSSSFAKQIPRVAAHRPYT